MDCPFECTYLQDAHEHERPPELDPSTLPNRDIEITEDFQNDFTLRPPILVGFFLAGLVIHGGLQQWWIAPVLGSLGEVPPFAIMVRTDHGHDALQLSL